MHLFCACTLLNSGLDSRRDGRARPGRNKRSRSALSLSWTPVWQRGSLWWKWTHARNPTNWHKFISYSKLQWNLLAGAPISRARASYRQFGAQFGLEGEVEIMRIPSKEAVGIRYTGWA